MKKLGFSLIKSYRAGNQFMGFFFALSESASLVLSKVEDPLWRSPKPPEDQHQNRHEYSIPQADDLFPWRLRMISTKVIREISGCFANYLQLPNYTVLNKLSLLELLQ
jgi:hypothetical protein